MAQFLEGQLQALYNAYASGVLEVVYDNGNKTVFPSVSDLEKRIAFIEGRLGVVANTGDTTSVGCVSKGDCC